MGKGKKAGREQVESSQRERELWEKEGKKDGCVSSGWFSWDFGMSLLLLDSFSAGQERRRCRMSWWMDLWRGKMGWDPGGWRSAVSQCQTRGWRWRESATTTEWQDREEQNNQHTTLSCRFDDLWVLGSKQMKPLFKGERNKGLIGFDQNEWMNANLQFSALSFKTFSSTMLELHHMTSNSTIVYHNRILKWLPLCPR